MLFLIALSVFMVALAGLAVKLLLDWRKASAEITWREFGIGMVAVSLVLAPLTVYLGWQMAKANALSFNEYWNGWEKEAQWIKIPCSKNGSCRNAYDCDPYTVLVPYSCGCDSKGNCSTCLIPETHYDRCPYCTEEWTFNIDTTLGPYAIAAHRLPENPQAHQWREVNGGIPQGVLDRAGVGIPEFWIAAKERIGAGVPGPVTKRMTYDNYILASDRTMLKQHSSAIGQYAAAQLLPDLESGVHDFYWARKVKFVGYAPENPDTWHASLMYLNAALGTELQGDLHLVIVRDERISRDPDAYLLALKAYWQNKEVFGDNALSKNAIVVAVGTHDGKTVSWGRAITGMPVGNDAMLGAIQSALGDISLTPERVIGTVSGQFYEKEQARGSKELAVRGLHGNGALERILWGLDDPQTKFTRVSMAAKDPGDVGGGFLYLAGEIEPDAWQKFWIAFVAFLVGMLAWFAAAQIGERHHEGMWKRSRTY